MSWLIILLIATGTLFEITLAETPLICGENEVYSKCGRDGCLKFYCSDLDLPPLCRDGPCAPSCDCKDGYLRTSFDNDTCIPEGQCERKCKDNEYYSDCPVQRCEPRTCKEKDTTVSCPPLGDNGECPVQPACICNTGFLKDDSGKCIPSNECTPTCNENEEVSTCSNAECYQNCADIGETIACPAVAIESCTTGCVCKQDYFRAENGTCVPQNQCDSTCPGGGVLSTCPPVKCDAEYCPLSRDSPQTCPTPKKCGAPRCVCGFNQHRDRKTGNCIATASCPPFSCSGPNEKYQSCPPKCPGEKCSDYLNKTATCPKIGHIDIVVPCKPACRCNKGYYRNLNGICIPGIQCRRVVPVPIISTPVQLPSNTQTSAQASASASSSTAAEPSSPSGPSPPPATGVPSTPSSTSPVKSDPSTTIQDTCDADAQENALENGNTAFTGKFFYQVVKNNPEVSVIMSPFSVLTPLGILSLYTDGKTNQELLSVLNLKTKDDVRCAFPGVLDSIKASNGTELDSGAKLYVYKQGQLSQSLQNDAKTVFDAEAESLDFNNPQNASDVINQWVSDVTKGKITQLTSPDMFNSMTRLVIANAIYFKGSWKYKFDANKTTTRDFYVNSNKTIQVPTMQQKGKFRYAELSDPDIQVVELPYEDENISFLVILPSNGTNDLLSVVEKMQDPQMLNNIYSNLYQQTVTIYLPKIPKVSTKSNLVNILESIGIEALFDPSSAELSGLTDPNENLYVSDAIQEATLTVDESGSEASAANAFGVTALSAVVGEPIEYVFDANRPYALYININRNITLFCAAYYG